MLPTRLFKSIRYTLIIATALLPALASAPAQIASAAPTEPSPTDVVEAASTYQEAQASGHFNAASSSPDTWTWMSGSDAIYEPGIYGTKGVASPDNMPGVRASGISWTDAEGNLWLFGGEGYDSTSHYGRLNDLWKYDGSNWTWVSGSNLSGQPGVYGTKGVASPSSVPGGRWDSVSWIDVEGNLWLFGGYIYKSSTFNYGYLNDLWKFDGANWTWVSGSSVSGQSGIYGTKGVASPSNVPGARQESISWIDAGGTLWLFGGHGYDSTGKMGYLNDLWKFDGVNWTWVSGPDVTEQPGIYGTKGVASPNTVPGARRESVSWTDAAGNLWLFGGSGYPGVGSYGILNDLWKFDGANWTWVSGSDIAGRPGIYGTKGVASPSNVPGGRSGSISWIDVEGNLWLFGGTGCDSAGSCSRLNDLWKFDGINWTWVSGSNVVRHPGVYGTQGVASPSNAPSARIDSVAWTDATGNLWLLGGLEEGGWTSGGYRNDLWKFDGANWTWVSGSDLIYRPGVYGTKGVASPNNMPGAREDSVSWTDEADNLWLFGGEGRDRTGSGRYLNDLWKFDGANWTWVSGSDIADQPGIYGTKGVASPSNMPGARWGGISWTDAAGNLWLFGGGSRVAYLNDLWKYDGENWTWVSGSNGITQLGVYGAKGVASPSNMPGGRARSVAWIDATGNLWLFGGIGYDSGSGFGALNDLWKYDGSNWTWVSGSNRIDQPGVYGSKGVTSANNTPGGHYGGVSWTDRSGNLWLFGGRGSDGNNNAHTYLNDLWKYDGDNWTWVSGSDVGSQQGVYGNKGIPHPDNTPGARDGSSSWTDVAGNLWLFGGLHGQYFNDLWKFDGTNWTWISGANVVSQPGVYGAKGVASSSNVPGARHESISWADTAGNLWLLGGWGLDGTGGAVYDGTVSRGLLNDLWKYETPYTPPPTGDLTVNSTLDRVDADPTNGICETVPGNRVCTLRAAIQEANTRPGSQTIVVPEGMYRLSISGTGEDLAAKGDLDITDDVTITGDGPDTTMILGGYLDRVLHITGAYTVNISGVTVRNGGNIKQCGGGISSKGTLTLVNSRVSNNRVVSPGLGGGICNLGTLKLLNSTVSQNAAAQGGGIYSSQTAEISGSTINGNSANAGLGGGITSAGWSGALASLTITNSTISGNNVSGGTSPAGSGLYGTNLTATIASSTISHNLGGTSSGIEARSSSTFTFRNTIIAGHSGPNCRRSSGTLTSGGHNLSDDASCNLTGTGDLPNTEPGLGPLQDNGGPTFTHALAVGSPALDAGGSAACPATDQRGIARDEACDIGAYEGSTSDIVLIADLVAETPYLNQWPSLGGTATVGVVISNRGTKAVGPFEVRFRYYKLDPSDPYNPARKTLLHTSVQDITAGLGAGQFVRLTDATFVVPQNGALYEVEVTADPVEE